MKEENKEGTNEEMIGVTIEGMIEIEEMIAEKTEEVTEDNRERRLAEKIEENKDSRLLLIKPNNNKRINLEKLP